MGPATVEVEVRKLHHLRDELLDEDEDAAMAIQTALIRLMQDEVIHGCSTFSGMSLLLSCRICVAMLDTWARPDDLNFCARWEDMVASIEEAREQINKQFFMFVRLEELKTKEIFKRVAPSGAIHGFRANYLLGRPCARFTVLDVLAGHEQTEATYDDKDELVTPKGAPHETGPISLDAIIGKKGYAATCSSGVKITEMLQQYVQPRGACWGGGPTGRPPS